MSATVTAEGGDGACGPPVPGRYPRNAKTTHAISAISPIARGIAVLTPATGLSQKTSELHKQAHRYMPNGP
jgi:hypothetical protein